MTAVRYTLGEGEDRRDTEVATGQTDPAAGNVEVKISDNINKGAALRTLRSIWRRVAEDAWPDGTIHD